MHGKQHAGHAEVAALNTLAALHAFATRTIACFFHLQHCMSLHLDHFMASPPSAIYAMCLPCTPLHVFSNFLIACVCHFQHCTCADCLHAGTCSYALCVAARFSSLFPAPHASCVLAPLIIHTSSCLPHCPRFSSMHTLAPPQPDRAPTPTTLASMH